MPHYSDYRCGVCGKEFFKDLLLAKKMVWVKLGAGGRIIKSRTVIWQCPECRTADPDWNRDAYTASPGAKSPALENVRAMQGKNT